ncbi:MAG: uroporphyrinogen-III C-methyltransferase [Pseudomonadota bacterium]|jgi:uroporphyrin-III C-methyltransferase
MSTPKREGKVWLVGAGPGAADLLTLRAARAIEGAEAVLYDALVPAEIVELAPRGALRIETGKRAHRPSMSQAAINRLMVKLARRGLRVVRLKGGDPSIFGRVGEELEHLARAGVDAEVIPGVTAASAAAAQFQLPLTHRGVARRVVFATARTEGGALRGDWRYEAETTLVLYMARDSLEAIVAALREQGMPDSTRLAVVENAGRDNARLLRGSAGNAAALASAITRTAPALVIIGDVVEARQDYGSPNGLLKSVISTTVGTEIAA